MFPTGNHFILVDDTDQNQAKKNAEETPRHLMIL